MEWTLKIPCIEGSYLVMISERLAIVDLWFNRNDEAEITYKGIFVRMGSGAYREDEIESVDYWTTKHIPPLPTEGEII